MAASVDMSKRETAADVSSDTHSPPTVLFVDDDPELLEVYEMRFSREFAVLTAESGEEAIRIFTDEIDFAFVDRRMPDRSGEEVIQTLRDRNYDTPMGIISAVDRDIGVEVDHDVYFTKPPTVDHLREAVLEHVE
jgi:DNA-binding response OmpR family regulator